MLGTHYRARQPRWVGGAPVYAISMTQSCVPSKSIRPTYCPAPSPFFFSSGWSGTLVDRNHDEKKTAVHTRQVKSCTHPSIQISSLRRPTPHYSLGCRKHRHYISNKRDTSFATKHKHPLVLSSCGALKNNCAAYVYLTFAGSETKG